MTYSLGWRSTFGVIIPSTNTVVEADYARMSVPGVTAHAGRIHIRDQNLSSDKNFEGLLDQIRAEIKAACERVLTCEPDAMIMGMSAETFWGGVEGNLAFQREIEDLTGMPVVTGAAACDRALRLFGARKLGIITPYQPIGDENVRRFFTESGYDVVHIVGLRCESAVAIARVDESVLRGALCELAGRGVDAIVQVGTNLSMVQLADEAERWLGIPVIAINAATWWMALREHGFDDRTHGSGRLLREH